MKKVIPIVVVAAVVVAGVIVAVVNHSSNNNATSMNMSSNSSSSNTHSSSATATDKISISNFSFSPASVTVKKGTSVTWTNQDSVAHTVVETDGKDGPQSQSVSKGQSYSFTYNTVGSFAYHCSIHPDMTGTVTVTN